MELFQARATESRRSCPDLWIFKRPFSRSTTKQIKFAAPRLIFRSMSNVEKDDGRVGILRRKWGDLDLTRACTSVSEETRGAPQPIMRRDWKWIAATTSASRVVCFLNDARSNVNFVNFECFCYVFHRYETGIFLERMILRETYKWKLVCYKGFLFRLFQRLWWTLYAYGRR